MTQKVKDRLITAIIGLFTGFAVILFGTFVSGKTDNNDRIRKKIESLEKDKVDKTEFIRYAKDNEEKHQSIEENINKNLEKTEKNINDKIETTEKNLKEKLDIIINYSKN